MKYNQALKIHKRILEMAKKEGTRKKSAEKPDLKDFLLEVQERAYYLYCERQAKGLAGNDLEDWLSAEAEIKKKYGI